MSTPSSHTEPGRSARRVALDIVLLVAIPTIVIFILSKIWR